MQKDKKILSTDEYMEQFLEFLEGLGVTPRYFSPAERERWLAGVRSAYEDLVKSRPKKPRDKKR